MTFTFMFNRKHFWYSHEICKEEIWHRINQIWTKREKNGGRHFLLNTMVRINYAKDNYIPELWLKSPSQLPLPVTVTHRNCREISWSHVPWTGCQFPAEGGKGAEGDQNKNDGMANKINIRKRKAGSLSGQNQQRRQQLFLGLVKRLEKAGVTLFLSR